MMRGDLDNTSPARWMVTIEALTNGQLPAKKTWRKSWKTIARETPFEPLSLGRCWRISNKLGVRFECVTFDVPFEYCEALEEVLDHKGVHPIAWVTGFESREALRASLPFRPDVTAVVDLREFALYWGAKGYSMEDL